MSKRKRKGATLPLAKSWSSDPNLSEALEPVEKINRRAADLQRAAEEFLKSGDVARRIESRERLRNIIESLVVMVPVEIKKLQVFVGTQSEPLACSSLGTQIKQVMQPVKSVNYASVVKEKIVMYRIRGNPEVRKTASCQSLAPGVLQRERRKSTAQEYKTRVLYPWKGGRKSSVEMFWRGSEHQNP